MKILITGAQGQLGTELRHLLDSRDIAYRGTDAHDLDITDEKAVDQYFKDYQPDLIYHCAAYTAVDKAEDEGKALNQKVNVDGTRILAKAAAAIDATLVYISTDYVFDGDKKIFTPLMISRHRVMSTVGPSMKANNRFRNTSRSIILSALQGCLANMVTTLFIPCWISLRRIRS